MDSDKFIEEVSLSELVVVGPIILLVGGVFGVKGVERSEGPGESMGFAFCWSFFVRTVCLRFSVLIGETIFV